MAYLWRSSLVQPIQFFERLTLGTNIASLRWRTLPERDDKEIVPMSEIESRVWSPVKTTLSRAIGIRVALSLVVIRYLPWIRTESLLSSAFIFFCIRHIKVTGFEPMALCTQNRCADQTALHLVSPPPEHIDPPDRWTLEPNSPILLGTGTREPIRGFNRFFFSFTTCTIRLFAFLFHFFFNPARSRLRV